MRDFCILITCVSSLMFATDRSMLAAGSSYRARARSRVSPEVIDEELQRTSADFNVSLDVLKALVFIGSRTHSVSEVDGPGDVPRAFGTMGLHEDDWFGRNVTRASTLLGVSSELIRQNAVRYDTLWNQQHPKPRKPDLESFLARSSNVAWSKTARMDFLRTTGLVANRFGCLGDPCRLRRP